MKYIGVDNRTMKKNNFWGPSRSSGVKIGMIVRVGLALFAVLGSVVFAFLLISGRLGAHASGAAPLEIPTTQNPWGVAFDNSGNIWVAEPACNASPICATPPAGVIGEYNTASFTKVKDFTPPTIYNPVFLVVNGSGNVWFTDPTHNAIGELVPASNTWTEFPVQTANAAPYDLVLDAQGNVWFTEQLGNKIGFFNTTSHAIVESTVPTAASHPYGITLVSSTGDMWFTENGAAKIANFTPTLNGTLAAGAIKEHAITNAGPHLITSDKATGTIWYSEGFSGSVGNSGFVGNFVPSSNTHKDFNVSLNACTPGCHISGIGVDNTGQIWFDDSLSTRVGFLNPTTGVVGTVTLSNAVAHPHDGLIVDSSGNTWFTEQNGFNLAKVPAGSITPNPSVTPSPTGTPTTFPPGPVNATWYFAEGRVGGGFKEFLTLGNPSANICTVNINYFYTLDGGAPLTKTVSVTIQHASRLTEPVNSDLAIGPTQTPAASVGAVVSVSNGPTCSGIVAERPVYFNSNGVNSGTDVLGATHLGTTFNFADVATSGGYSSFISVLNPGASAATLTATFYAGGAAVGTPQTATVAAGSRGLVPIPNGLPTHVAAVVTSNQPVLVERPEYFTNVNTGSPGTFSGATDIVGSQTTANDWLFAEGFIGNPNQQFQENLIIANVSAAPAAVTITLEYTNGSAVPFNLTIGPKSQTIWSVNAQPAGASPEVSAEVKSTGANILVERQLFFRYDHIVNSVGTPAVGATEVFGQLGPAAKSSYSFGEGYTNVGYNEWLTLQNPTANPETIYFTLVNSKGHTYTGSQVVVAHSRATVDITATVLQHLVGPSPNFQDYEVSMTVQTLNNGGAFVAERPMYFDAVAAGLSVKVQGGSDIIGYAGG